MCDTIEEAVAKWNRRAPAQSVTHPSLVKALNDLHVWLEIEGCSDQVEIIDDAFSAAGITEYRCANCDGAGEWDEGPLPDTSSTQISPDYRHMVCSDCEGKGTISLSSAQCGDGK
jgi:DnaJ-class molecular chaperone